MYGQSQKLVSTLHELHALLDDLRNLPAGDIKVGIPPLVGTVVFPMIAKNFTSKHPQVKLELVELGAKRIVELVENEQVDLGIIVLPIQNPLFTSIRLLKKSLIYTFIMSIRWQLNQLLL